MFPNERKSSPPPPPTTLNDLGGELVKVRANSFTSEGELAEVIGDK